MSIAEVIEKYLQLINTEFFAKYEKSLTIAIQTGLIKGYIQGSDEPNMVKSIVESINKENHLHKSHFDGFSISTKSIFIHGKQSVVEFEYYDTKTHRELGDLIFIISVFYKNKKYFEKFTITQSKKAKKDFRLDLSNKEQIYLLSRFPSFKGHGSLIPNTEFCLPNYSGCLGSFNLLFSPGDFVFISARQLECILGNRKSINIIDIAKLWKPPCAFYPTLFYFDPLDYLRYKLLLELLNSLRYCPYLPHCMGVLGVSHYASNIHDFVDKYLRGYIGELNFLDGEAYNKPAYDFLRELLSALKIKARRDGNQELVKFVEEFFNRDGNQRGMKENIEFDYEGGGIGITHTSIDLGEGRE